MLHSTEFWLVFTGSEPMLSNIMAENISFENEKKPQTLDIQTLSIIPFGHFSAENISFENEKKLQTLDFQTLSIIPFRTLFTRKYSV